MENIVLYTFYTILASICAFIKLFYKTTNYSVFIVLGIVFSILEFLFRIPTKSLGLEKLGLQVSSMQIIWVGANLLISSLLSILMYGDIIGTNKIIGMLMILFGICIVSVS
jgi:hypothetical protein